MGSFLSRFKDYSRNAWHSSQHWLLRVIDLYEWVVRFISALHQAITAFVVTIAVVMPLVGLLIEALGLLVSPIRSIFSSSSTKPINHISMGLKIFTASIIVACVVVGFVFPPAGLSMILIGLCAGAMHQAYKTYRTANKYMESSNNDHHQLPKTVSDYEQKLKHRGASLLLSGINIALLSVTLLFPPAAIFSLPLLIAINIGVAIHQYARHTSQAKSRSVEESSDAPITNHEVPSNHDLDSPSASEEGLDTNTHSIETNSDSVNNETVEEGALAILEDVPSYSSTPLSEQHWSGSMLVVAGSMYAFAGCFDLAIVMVTIFVATFKLAQRSSETMGTNTMPQLEDDSSQPNANEDVTSDITSHESQESLASVVDHQRPVADFLHAMDHHVRPRTSSTYQECHAHSHSSQSDESETTHDRDSVSSESAMIGRFLDDEVHVLTRHSLPERHVNMERDELLIDSGVRVSQDEDTSKRLTD
ncbi:MAG: hypothetical protein CL816_05710 [Coxiellaceae bacterium]|nr:hypothetical protein [Coxiellaceae bacterium]